MHDFSVFQTVPKIVFGNGAIDSLGDEAKRLGATKTVVVTDPGLVKARVHEPAMAALEDAGLNPALYQDVESDPKLEVVDSCLDFIRSHGADLVVGLGGGSAMDISKAAAIMVKNEGPINKYAGVNLVPGPGLPTILVPTTAGTGSEVTSIAVLTDTKNRIKVGVVSDYMFANTALLDPRLTLGLPPHVTAFTGLDALVHAIESYTGRMSSFITEVLALKALKLIAGNLRLAYADGSNIDARSNMLKASLLAGMAFGNTQTAGAHACALAIGEKYHIPHGIATSLMLPSIMSFNSIAVPEKYAKIAEAFGENINGLGRMDQADLAIKAIVRLIRDTGFTLGLENYNVSKEEISEIAKGAMGAARLWKNNPRHCTEEQVCNIFANAFES